MKSIKASKSELPEEGCGGGGGGSSRILESQSWMFFWMYSKFPTGQLETPTTKAKAKKKKKSQSWDFENLGGNKSWYSTFCPLDQSFFGKI